MKFEWDSDKAEKNIKKHKVSFEEAVTVLRDPLSITISDSDHSGEEKRFIDIGRSDKDRVLVVVYTARGQNLRIISCRRATSSELKFYEEGETGND